MTDDVLGLMMYVVQDSSPTLWDVSALINHVSFHWFCSSLEASVKRSLYLMTSLAHDEPAGHLTIFRWYISAAFSWRITMHHNDALLS